MLRVFQLLMIVAVLFVSGSRSASAPLRGACPAFSTCSTCLQEGADCQWCPSQSQCLAATSNCSTTAANGPPVTSSSACECANPETTFEACDSCLNSGCAGLGWCPSAAQCLFSADGTEPFGSSCAASGTKGYWTVDSGNCRCTNPTSVLTTCESCTNNCVMNGWCPSSGSCFAGNTSTPFNTTCAATAANGAWSQDSTQCACADPVANLHTCDACTQNGCSNTWCPSSRTCFYLPNDGTPLNGTVCTESTDLGPLSSDCTCIEPIFISDDSTCDGCTSQNFTWCYNQRRCQARTPSLPDPCPPRSCGATCSCLPVGTSSILTELFGGSDNCTTCQSGYTNPAGGCLDRCDPHCGSCDPNNGTLCLGKCRTGFTGFPSCTTPCPPGCRACGGAWPNSTSITMCAACADPGAMAPNCSQCIPSVCRGATGACDSPCPGTIAADAALRYERLQSGAEAVDVTATLEDDGPAYNDCDACKDAAGRLQSLIQLTAKVFSSDEEAEIALAALSAACVVLPPPFDGYCEFSVISYEEDGKAVAIIDWALEEANGWLFEEDTCMALRLCPFPCSPNRNTIR